MHLNIAAASRINLLVLLLVCLTSISCDQHTPIYTDEKGIIHGTGEMKYHYETGELMLREEWVNGKCEVSRWYTPQGTLVWETDWIDESGIGVYLRQDGSIRVRMTYVNGLAEGPATYYDASGNVTKQREYKDGQPVADQKSDAESATD